MEFQAESYAQWDSNSNQGNRDDACSTAEAEAKDQRYEEDLDADEQSPLEYARLCGFCKDFLLDNPIDICALSPLPTDSELDIRNPNGAVAVTDIFVNELTCERIEINKGACLVLKKVIFPGEEFCPLDILPERSPKRGLGLELPLLLTDHDMDMRNFGLVPGPHFHQLKLPTEHVNIENDGDLEWPQKYRHLPEEMLKEIEGEKLECSRHAVKYLQDLVLDTADDQDLNMLYSQSEAYRGQEKMEPVTPPLLPLLSPLLAPFDPSSETGQLPLLSDTTDSIAAEDELLDQYLQDHDQILGLHFESGDKPRPEDTVDVAQMYIPLQSDLQSDGVSPPPKHKREILTVEVPLVASDGNSSSSSTRRKSVAFAEQLQMITLDLPPTHPADQLDPESEVSLEEFFNNVIEPLAQEATQTVEQEQLQTADSLQRIEVPVMDFSLLPPPWKTGARKTLSGVNSAKVILEEWRKTLCEINKAANQLQEYSVWKISEKTERQLKSYPFDAELGEVPKEVIDDSGYIVAITSGTSLENVVTSDDLVWKPEGLRILRRAEYEMDDDELELLQHGQDEAGECCNVECFVRKRQREVDAAERRNENHISPASDYLPVRSRDGPQTAPLVRAMLSSSQRQTGANVVVTNRFFADHFTTARCLSNFMDSIGQPSKRQRLDEVTKSIQQMPAQPLKAAARPPTAALQPQITSVEDVPYQQPIVMPFDLPPLPSPLSPRCIILSSSLLLTHRQILRTVFKDMYRTAIHIERDFSLVDEAPEADILLSPGTGLVFTNSQKVKQKALPGQELHLAGIKNRIAKLAMRYELLIVLVSDALSADALCMDQRDCEAIADFAAFCSNCKADVLVTYVPGGEDNIAAWVATSIHKYGDTGQDMLLLQDETMWEQTLRCCGLNAYAAQTVLVSLKAGDLSSDSDLLQGMTPSITDESVGIRAFVRMSPEERITRLEGPLGGRKVLQRVNKVLEQHWLSAKTNFRQAA